MKAGGNAEKNGKLQLGDRFMKVNGIDASKGSKSDVIAAVKAAIAAGMTRHEHHPIAAGITVNLVMKRKRPAAPTTVVAVPAAAPSPPSHVVVAAATGPTDDYVTAGRMAQSSFGDRFFLLRSLVTDATTEMWANEPPAGMKPPYMRSNTQHAT
jgi:hypothetical protein